MANKLGILYTRESPQAGDDMTVKGYAARFDTPTQLWRGRWEIIRAGAYARTLREGADVRALFNHDQNLVLGRSVNGTLTLREDEQGLWYEIRLNPKDPDHVSAYAKIERGDVTQSSFAFFVAPGGESPVKRDNYPAGVPTDDSLHELTDLDLVDVSPVTFPAYVDTSVAARSGMLGEWAREALRVMERESGNTESNQGNVPVESQASGPAPRSNLARYREREMQARLRQGGKI